MSKWSPEAVTDIVLRALEQPGFAVVVLWRNEHGIQHEALGDLSVIADVVRKLDAEAEQ